MRVDEWGDATINHQNVKRRGGIRFVSQITRSASYRFNIAKVPNVATIARAHCPKRPWTFDGGSACLVRHFRFLLSCARSFLALPGGSLACNSLAQ